jgi:hypothetical protein
VDAAALARIASVAHLPHIETGIGPSEAKAERPARKRGFWNRIDATARCRAVEERDEASAGSLPGADRIPDR